MARKIFVGNYKGGVGKTTFTYNMGCILKEKGEKVVLIDLDPQSSLSEICLTGEEKFQKLKNDETFNNVIDIYSKAIKSSVYEALKFDTEKIIKDNGKVKFIPSSYFYKKGGLDIQCLNMKRHINDVLIVKWFIENNRLDKEFDYIIFDCPPSNNIVTLSSFFASDYYIIPTIMDAISSRGVSHYEALLKQFYSEYLKKKTDVADKAKGQEPILLGVFETRRKSQSNGINIYRKSISDNFNLFKTIVYDYVEIADSIGRGEPSKRVEFINLVDEVVSKINEIEGIKNE